MAVFNKDWDKIVSNALDNLSSAHISYSGNVMRVNYVISRRFFFLKKRSCLEIWVPKESRHYGSGMDDPYYTAEPSNETLKKLRALHKTLKKGKKQ